MGYDFEIPSVFAKSDDEALSGNSILAIFYFVISIILIGIQSDNLEVCHGRGDLLMSVDGQHPDGDGNDSTLIKELQAEVALKNQTIKILAMGKSVDRLPSDTLEQGMR